MQYDVDVNFWKLTKKNTLTTNTGWQSIYKKMKQNGHFQENGKGGCE